MTVEVFDSLDIWGTAMMNRGGTFTRQYDDYGKVVDHGGFYSAERGGVVLGSTKLFTNAVLEAVTEAWREDELEGHVVQFGIWVADGKVYIDKVKWFVNEDSAVVHSETNGQTAYWDITNGKAVQV